MNIATSLNQNLFSPVRGDASSSSAVNAALTKLHRIILIPFVVSLSNPYELL